MAMIGSIVMEIENFINPPQKSKMAAKMSDLNKLCNLDRPKVDIQKYEI